MRLISWDGMRDVSYGNCHLVINPKTFEIEAKTNNTDFEPIMGIYSTEAKALKVMEMLRSAYVGLPILFQNVDMNESVVEKLKEWKRDGIVLLHDNADSKIEQVNNAIFKFPADEEVEV